MRQSFFHYGRLSLLLLGLCLGWVMPAQAVDPDLIDVVEITGTNPIVVEGNILPGDTFTRTLTVKNLTTIPQDIAVRFDLDADGQIVWVPGFELEDVLKVQIKNLTTDAVIALPGAGKLGDLDAFVLALGSLPGNETYQYQITVEFDINAGNEYQRTQVRFNLMLGIDIEIVDESARLILRKFNDSVSNEVPGNEVVYTLEVTALGGPVEDVTVTDLPPEGFAYVVGSGTGAPFIHEYASPGIWDLGDMAEGETKTLQYETVISDSQDAGLYRDLAFARGKSGVATVYANSESDPFVGTDVNVVLPVSEPVVTLDEDKKEKTERKTKTKVQYVLGASTGLPLTGMSWQLLALGCAGIVLGIGLRFLARRHFSRSIGALILLALFGLGSVPNMVSAATLSAKIETPETVMTTQNFKIGFVVLDVLARPIEVACYTTASPVPFATYTLESSFGGNSGDCSVSASVVPTDGNYEFYIQATATGEGSEMVESDHVTVTVATSTPGTPYNYERKDPGCDNIISFTTASDGGKTVKVELYRSTENPFVASSATKVSETALGSNVNGSFTVAAPSCDDDIFYAVRAVDALGQGSGFIGDIDVDTEIKTETRTRINTVTVPGAPTGAIPTEGSAALPAAVQGVETENTEAGSLAGEETSTEGEGSVLGEMTEAVAAEASSWTKDHPYLTVLLAALALIIGYMGYRFLFGRKSHDIPLE